MRMPFISLLLLALAVSLDGFGVGVTYGLRKIKIPLLSIFIIAVCSGLIIFGSMQIGSWLLTYLNPIHAKIMGSIILIGIGLWAIYQIMNQKDEDVKHVSEAPDADKETKEKTSLKPIIHIEIKKLDIVIEILRTPSKADMDHSGIISASEAAILGIALSLDAFGAGIGAGLIGFSPWLTAIVISLSCGLFLFAGLRVGFIFSENHWVRRLSVIPGFILIAMGIFKLF
jgi:putative sporulation protein YtaF